MKVIDLTLIRFTIPGLRAVNPTNGSHGHWAINSTRVKAARLATWRAAIVAGVVPLRDGEQARVMLVRIGPKPLDDDNLRPSLKGPRDEIARRLGLDDRDPRISWDYGQERAGRAYAVRVEIRMEMQRG